MSTFTIKQGDTSPVIESVLRNGDGSPVDLTTASVRLVVETIDGELVLNEPASAQDPVGGVVVYEWRPGDTDYPGKHRAEWRVTFDDGTVETFPNADYLYLYIPSSVSDT